MFGAKKRRILSWSVTISILLSSCSGSPDQITINGEAQGTTYTVILAGEHSDVMKAEIDSLLHAFDESLSSYIPTSVLSRINQSTDSIVVLDNGFFKPCYLLSRGVYDMSAGAFDPSVFPLVQGWGFMNNMETPLDKDSVASILKYVSFQKDLLHSIYFNGDTITFSKYDPRFKLDFNAIAQGYSVDVVAEYLNQHGVSNYYVEIGGEIVVKGKNGERKKWRIGIDSPIENADTRVIENIIHVTNKAIATSGNYRKFYVKDGVKYAHTLDPLTGYPVQHSLLSATVLADNCALADAYATTFMVYGVEKTMQFLEEHPELKLEVYLLYTKDNGEVGREMSEGFQKYLEP